jgi:hypothetical protein
MMQKSTTFTTIFRVKKCYFHYDFACKKVSLSLRYAKKYIFLSKFSFEINHNDKNITSKRDYVRRCVLVIGLRILV